MTSNIRIRELLKTAAIAMLSVSAVFLICVMWLDGRLLTAGMRGERIQSGAPPVASAYLEAARPFFIAVTNDKGERYAAKNNEAAVSAVYDRVSVLLAEALGSSEQPREVYEDEWREALCGAGVFFDFISEQPLSAVAAWLGTDAGSGASKHSARRICLSGAGDMVSLYYIEADGLPYRCSTALSAGALSAARIEEYAPNGAKFAFEFESELSNVDAYTLITGGQPTAYDLVMSSAALSAANPAELSGSFGMELAPPYTESDGSVVFVDSSGSALRLDADGSVTYRAQGDDGFLLGRPGGLNTLADIIDAAFSFCINGPMAGNAHSGIYLSGVSYGGDEAEYTLTFDYAIYGAPVILGEGHAAQLTISGERIKYAAMRLLDFAVAGEKPDVLRERPAAAIIQASGGGEPLLVYAESGGVISACWIVNRI